MLKVINVINTNLLKKEEIEKLIDFYKNLDKTKVDLVVILSKGNKLRNKLKKLNVKVVEVENLDSMKCFLKLIKIYKEEKPMIIHSYENRIAQIAAKFIKECKAFYTGKIISDGKKNKIKSLFLNDLLVDKISTFDEIFNEDEKNNEKDVSTESIYNIYETLEREPEMKKINLLDIFIIFIVLIICIVGYIFIKGNNNVINSATTKVIYQIRATEVYEEVFDMIEEGTPIYESRKNYCIGTVIKKESGDSMRVAINRETGAYVETKIDDCIDIILTIEADAIKDDQNIMVQDFEVKVGSEAFVKGKGYASIGYVVSVER